jgi:hypothetical protein
MSFAPVSRMNGEVVAAKIPASPGTKKERQFAPPPLFG